MFSRLESSFSLTGASERSNSLPKTSFHFSMRRFWSCIEITTLSQLIIYNQSPFHCKQNIDFQSRKHRDLLHKPRCFLDWNQAFRFQWTESRGRRSFYPDRKCFETTSTIDYYLPYSGVTRHSVGGLATTLKLTKMSTFKEFFVKYEKINVGSIILI